MNEITFRKVSARVWFVYSKNAYWGKLWQTMPSGQWGLVDKDHRRYILGQFLDPSKAKVKAATIVNGSYMEIN